MFIYTINVRPTGGVVATQGWGVFRNVFSKGLVAYFYEVETRPSSAGDDCRTQWALFEGSFEKNPNRNKLAQ
jgi:hypothetical protein